MQTVDVKFSEIDYEAGVVTEITLTFSDPALVTGLGDSHLNVGPSDTVRIPTRLAYSVHDH